MEPIKQADRPSVPPTDRRGTATVYRDERYALGREDGEVYLTADGRRYRLSCHPYEPCLYVTAADGGLTAVRNAFDPDVVLERFGRNETVTSITGRVYGARDFCRMVESAAGMGNIGIEDAEKLFGGRAGEKAAEEASGTKESRGFERKDRVGADDPFFAVLAEYPACVVDYCIVKNETAARGEDAHRAALLRACRELFADEEKGSLRADVARARAKRIDPAALFAPTDRGDALNYRAAFLNPPHGRDYPGKAFDRVNAALFPNGTDCLEAYEWTTDWSDYFDDGREWWGTLCDTVYDKTLDRFVAILASATD